MIWIFLLLAAAAITAVVYNRVIKQGFCYDDHAVLSNKPISDGDWWGQLRAPRGLVVSSYALNYKFSGQVGNEETGKVKAVQFHWTNCALHAATAVAVAILLKGLGLPAWQIGALFFLITPIATNAVANVAGRFSLISTLGMVVALLSVLYQIPILFAAGAIIAVWSKQDAVVIFPQAAILAYSLHQPMWYLYVILPCIVGVVAVLCSPRIRKFLSPAQVVIQAATGWPPHAVGWDYSCRFLVESVKRWPLWLLGTKFSISQDVDEKSWNSFALSAYLVLMAGLSCLVLPMPLSLGILLFLTSPWWTYLFKPMPDILLEHRAYGSLVGLAICVAYLSALAPLFLVGLWLGALAMITRERAGFWSPSLLFEKAIEDGSRKPMILLNQSSMLLQQGRVDEAEALVNEALKKAPNVYHAYGNLGTIAAMRQDARAMLAAYRRGAFRCPRMPMAWFVLGKAYVGQRKLSRALLCYRKALQLEPCNEEFQRAFFHLAKELKFPKLGQRPHQRYTNLDKKVAY